MNWALKRNDPLNLMDPIVKNEEDTMCLVNIIDTQFKYHLDRYKYSSRYCDNLNKLTPTDHRNEAVKILNHAENILQKSQANWFYNNKLSFADIAIFPLIRQFRIPDMDWFDNKMNHKSLIQWLHKMLELNIFKAVMKKYEIWHPENKNTFFGTNQH